MSELELRVALGGNEDGVCQVVVDEHENEVFVRVLVDVEDDPPGRSRDRECLDCPVRVWLERPLGERAVYRRGQRRGDSFFSSRRRT